MSEVEPDFNETAYQRAAINIRAVAVFEPVIKSMVDPKTSDFVNTAQVTAIRDNQAFARMYQQAYNDLHNLGTPSIPVTPARVIDYMVKHKVASLHITIPSHADLANAILAQAEAQDIKPEHRLTRNKNTMRPQPVTEIQTAFRFPVRKPSPQEVRLAEAQSLATRVLFDQDGNLKPGGVLKQPDIAAAYEVFKSDMDERIGTSRPIAEEVFAKNFVATVLGDKTHVLHEKLRESILRAGKKLPPEKPARATGGIRDQVRAGIENAEVPVGASR